MDWDAIPEIQHGVDLIVAQLEHIYEQGVSAGYRTDGETPPPDFQSIAFFIAGIGMGTAMRVMTKKTE